MKVKTGEGGGSYSLVTSWPLADLLGALHGISCVADVVGLESHHGLHFQHRGVDKSVVHTLIHSK